jgi:CO/xanthine dehydrogenase Mo-binding subunit
MRSPHPHVRIAKIDVSAAERLVSIPRSTYKDRYVLAEKACHVGEAIAAVAAETEELAEKAPALIQVEYEPYPAVFV